MTPQPMTTSVASSVSQSSSEVDVAKVTRAGMPRLMPARGVAASARRRAYRLSRSLPVRSFGRLPARRDRFPAR
jgi:hypothetical protein